MKGLVNRIKEYIAMLRLMRPIAKLRILILGIYGISALIVMGFLFGSLSVSYILLSAAAIIVYIIIIVLEVLNQ